LALRDVRRERRGDHRGCARNGIHRADGRRADRPPENNCEHIRSRPCGWQCRACHGKYLERRRQNRSTGRELPAEGRRGKPPELPKRTRRPWLGSTRRWWAAIDGLGVAAARHIEAFFAAYPQLTERARALIVVASPGNIVPWEQLRLPHEVDGSQGAFRAPRPACTLNATNDYEAVQAWLALHETSSTQRAYRKEAERLILWAIVERARALSSLTTDDAIAYRAFLRRPTPRERWVGPPRSRDSVEWRPFTGGLSARSTAYALTVLSALFRWLIEQRYVLANPFSGLKVRGPLLNKTLNNLVQSRTDQAKKQKHENQSNGNVEDV